MVDPTLLQSSLAFIATVVAAFVGTLVSYRLESRRKERRSYAKRRFEAAGALLPPLKDMRRLCRDAEHERSFLEWATSLEAAFDAIDDARHVLPPKVRHLKRSLRAAIGEAMGEVSWVDMLPVVADGGELAPYDAVWSSGAAEYIDIAIGAVRRWRDAKERDADRVSLIDFDAWLRVTGRYDPAGLGKP